MLSFFKKEKQRYSIYNMIHRYNMWSLYFQGMKTDGVVISVLFSGCSHLKPRLNSASIVISYVRNFFTLAIFYLFMI